jgi:hypothetical protein
MSDWGIVTLRSSMRASTFREIADILSRRMDRPRQNWPQTEI